MDTLPTICSAWEVGQAGLNDIEPFAVTGDSDKSIVRLEQTIY